MRERTIGAALVVAVVAAALAAGAAGVGILVVVLAALAGAEVERLLAAAGRPAVRRGVVGGAVILVLGAALPAILGGELLGRPAGAIPLAERLAAVDGIALAGAVAVGLAIVAFAQRDPAAGFGAWSSAVFGALYVGLLGSAALLAAGGAAEGGGAWAERRWVAVLLAGVWGFDTGAYLVGRAFGRRPFLSWISPKKTLEGVLGGLLAGTIAVALVLAASSSSWPEALVLGPLLGASAQAGDLAESLLKRAAGAKDSGTLIAGHGGVLDRVDSILFAAPVLAAWAAIVHG